MKYTQCTEKKRRSINFNFGCILLIIFLIITHYYYDPFFSCLIHINEYTKVQYDHQKERVQYDHK